jgi:hypothetical protein
MMPSTSRSKGVALMPSKKTDKAAEEKFTFAEARARGRKLKEVPPVEGKGGGAPVPYNETRKPPTPKVKR